MSLPTDSMVRGVEVGRPLNSHSFDAAPQHQQYGQPDATAVPRKPSLSLSAPTSGNKIHGVRQSTQSDHNQWTAPESPAAALTLDHLGPIERFFESDEANLKPVSPSLFNTADILYILLVHIYNIGVFKHVDSLCRKVQVTVASATIEIFIGYHPFSVQPPTWFWVLWEERRPGRGISEVSIGWIDTSWRTAHSVLHVGSISPLVAMPCLNQTRLRALWAASGSLTNGSDAVLAETPPLDPTTLPIRTHPVSRQKANRGAASAARAPREPSRPAKKRKLGVSGKKPDETPPPGGNGSAPRRPTERDAEPDNGRRWACHFFKLDPVRHMACLFHPQMCCRHVKSHLQRHHKLPFHCPTCFEIFKSGALRDAHIRARNCLRRDTPAYWDRYIPEDRMEELKDVTGGDWYAMWSVVFPDKEPPESPYTDASNQTGVAVGAVGDEVEPRFIEELSRTTLNPEQSREVMAALRRAFEVVSSPSENSHHPVVELGGEPEDDGQQQQLLDFQLIGDTSPGGLRSPSHQLSAPAGVRTPPEHAIYGPGRGGYMDTAASHAVHRTRQREHQLERELLSDDTWLQVSDGQDGSSVASRGSSHSMPAAPSQQPRNNFRERPLPYELSTSPLGMRPQTMAQPFDFTSRQPRTQSTQGNGTPELFDYGSQPTQLHHYLPAISQPSNTTHVGSTMPQLTVIPPSTIPPNTVVPQNLAPDVLDSSPHDQEFSEILEWLMAEMNRGHHSVNGQSDEQLLPLQEASRYASPTPSFQAHGHAATDTMINGDALDEVVIQIHDSPYFNNDANERSPKWPD